MVKHFLIDCTELSPVWHEFFPDWCLFVLSFYCPVNPMGSCQMLSVYLTTLLLGRLHSVSGLPVLCTFFCQKLTTALLDTAGENDFRKYFKINHHGRMLSTPQGTNPWPDHQFFIPPAYGMQGGYIVFVFSVCLSVCLSVNICFVSKISQELLYLEILYSWQVWLVVLWERK